jgi:hypothetical protein
MLCDPLGVLGAAAIPLHGEEMPSPASREDAADEERLTRPGPGSAALSNFSEKFTGRRGDGEYNPNNLPVSAPPCWDELGVGSFGDPVMTTRPASTAATRSPRKLAIGAIGSSPFTKALYLQTRVP